MAVSDAKRRANAKYDAKAYDRVILRIKKGKKEIIQEVANTSNKSFNGFVNEAIDEKINREKASDD